MGRRIYQIAEESFDSAILNPRAPKTACNFGEVLRKDPVKRFRGPFLTGIGSCQQSLNRVQIGSSGRRRLDGLVLQTSWRSS